MARDEVKLFGFRGSPFSLRVKWALSLKGIEYEYVEEDLSNKSSMLLQYNPLYKKVPVLVHNGKPIVESLLIVEYIDETWKNRPLLPEDPFERAKSRFWAKYVDDEFVPTIVRMASCARDQKDKVAEEARRILKTFESSLNPNKPFSGAESLGFMDIAVAWVGIWAPMLEKIIDVKLMDEENTPLLTTWFRNVLDADIIKECAPPVDDLLAHYKDYYDRRMAART